jgi:hypothetical protein
MKVSITKWMVFNADWHRKKYEGLRFGQAFINNLLPKVNDPEVFYEEDHNKVVCICLDRYVDQSVSEAHKGELDPARDKIIRDNLLRLSEKGRL